MSTHEARVTVAPADIDELGHVSNLVWLRYVLDAARAHSVAAGLDHAAYVALGSIFVVRRHELDYLAPAYAGDELVVTTFVSTWGAATCERRTTLARADKPMLRAVTTWAFVSTTTGRPTRVPPHVRAAFPPPSHSDGDAR